MNTSEQLDFITSKISELQTAVFHSHSNSVLNLNPTVIRVLKIDENGYLWFFVNRPPQAVNEFEKQFPVALNFYKKGVPFFVNLFGIARIVIDPEELVCAELDSEISNGIESDRILLSVKIANVNYYEKELDVKKSWFGKLKKAVAEIFVPAEDFYYNPETQNDRHYA
jgi:general stress protein 26